MKSVGGLFLKALLRNEKIVSGRLDANTSQGKQKKFSCRNQTVGRRGFKAGKLYRY